jgi:effector-binding domain-containing protein
MNRLWTVFLAVLLTAAFCFAQTAETKAPEAKAEAAKPATAKTTIAGEITVKTLPAITAVTVMEKATDYAPKEGYKAGMEGAGEAYNAMMKQGMNKLMAWMKTGGKPLGPCFAFYYQDPEKSPAKDLTCKIGFPTAEDAKGSDPVKIEKLPVTTNAVLTYKGPYEGSAEPWIAISKWIPEHGYEIVGAPSEVYLKGPGDNVKPDEYITEIHYPVKKIEAPAAPASDKK